MNIRHSVIPYSATEPHDVPLTALCCVRMNLINLKPPCPISGLKFIATNNCCVLHHISCTA